MADTVDLNEITEYFDDEETLAAKCAELADLIRASSKTYMFTGAGISTSAGIPSYRGPDGVWTRRAQGRAPPKGIRMEQAMPTYGHMAMAALIADGTVDFLVSQNVDGLHRRSGVPGRKIAELHGNTYKEVCWDCGAEYLRTFGVSERVNGSGSCRRCAARVPHFCHCTSRSCDACGATLADSIIHFGEDLPDCLNDAFRMGKKAELCISMGTSLRVTPAADIPALTAARGGKLVIVNLQVTPLDDDAHLIIRGKSDDVMERVMRLLGKEDLVVPFEDSAAAEAEAVRMGLGRTGSRSGAPPAYPDGLVVGNSRRSIEGSDNFKWKVYVRPIAQANPDAEVDSAIIESVTFGLHRTFSPRSVRVSQAPFELVRTGWGTFDVNVHVEFKSETGLAPLDTVHSLSFAARRTEAVVPIPTAS